MNIFTDNLWLHRNKDFLERVKKNNQAILYNAPYSSHLNPIERLWAHAKKQFGREVLCDVELSSTEEVQSFVEKAIVNVPPVFMKKHIISCIRKIVLELEAIKL